MNLQTLLTSKKCACGMQHMCEIKNILIEGGCINKIGELTKYYKNILIAADSNTYPLCGDKISAILGTRLQSTLIFEGADPLIPDESAIKQLSDALSDNTELIIGIGSGVIQDLCKYVSHVKNLPYYIVATAPSMDGYASKGAAMIIDNMKVTYDAHCPEAIICDTEILKAAPMDMIRAGYGDILGKFSCLNDWKLSHVVNDEYYCDYVADLTYQMLNSVKDLGKELQQRDETAVRLLTEALIGVGIAMAFVGNSRPASGSEHHMAHYFEITGLLTNEPYFMHGIDVAYSAVFTQMLREKLLKAGTPPLVSGHKREIWEENIKRIYQKAANEVISLQDKLGFYKMNRNTIYIEKWDEIKKVLSESPSSEQMKAYLSDCGLNIADYITEYGEDKINDGLVYAKDLKDRYSVLWLYYDTLLDKAKN